MSANNQGYSIEGIFLLLNASVALQICYYGMQCSGQ